MIGDYLFKHYLPGGRSCNQCHNYTGVVWGLAETPQKANILFATHGGLCASCMCKLIEAPECLIVTADLKLKEL